MAAPGRRCKLSFRGAAASAAAWRFAQTLGVTHEAPRSSERLKVTAPSDNPSKEEFYLHVAHLTDVSKAFVENAAKVAGFLLLALGWYATSKDARAFLASEPGITALAATAAGVAYVLSVVAQWIAYRVSGNSFRRLQAIAYLPESAYKTRRLSLTTLWVCAAGNGVLAALLIAAILHGLFTQS